MSFAKLSNLHLLRISAYHPVVGGAETICKRVSEKLRYVSLRVGLRGRFESDSVVGNDGIPGGYSISRVD